MRIVKHLAFFLIFCVLISSTLLVRYLFFPGPLQEDTIFLLPFKTSKYSIARSLARQNCVSYPRLFFSLSKLLSLKYTIKSGEYLIPRHSSPIQIIKIFNKGKSIIHKLSVVEGTTVSEVLNKINDINILSGKVSFVPEEGMLFPATYHYSYNDNKNSLLSRIHSDMKKLLEELWTQILPSSVIKTKQDLLTLASIIEKESGLMEERPIVASVFINRLRLNMPLQADPTVIYAITQGKYKLNRPLFKADLEISSPYNTYRNIGLPAGAICIPSLSSLKSVLNPANTRFLYFVANQDGSHEFSTNLEQHNTKVRNFRQKKLTK